MLKQIGAIIHQSINDVFHLYKQGGKTLYGLSFSLYVVFNLIGIAVGGAVVYAANFFWGKGDLLSGMNFLEILNYYWLDKPVFLQEFLSINAAVVTFSSVLFAIFIHKKERNMEPKYSLKNFADSFTVNEWSMIAVIFGVMALSLFLLYRPLFCLYDNNCWADTRSGAADFSKTAMLFTYLNKLVSLLKLILPYFLAIVMYYSYIRGKVTVEGLRRLFPEIVSIIVLSLITAGIHYQVSDFAAQYIVGLVTAIIPFKEALIPLVMVLALTLIISAFFYLAGSAFILFPLKSRQLEKDQVDDL